MAILQVVQKVALRAIGKSPTSAFAPTSDQQTVNEIVDLAGDVARDIAASHDWQVLTRIDTITGDGTEKQFDLPSDYDRMLLASGLLDPDTWFWGYCHIPTVMQWLAEESYGFETITPGAWIILENQFNFVPAPASGAEAKYPYITKNIVVEADGTTTKENFETDTDSFRLNERLLTLGTLWRWKEQKGLEYAEDMQTYEAVLSQQQTRDSGARVIRSGPRLARGLFSRSYPWELG